MTVKSRARDHACLAAFWRRVRRSRPERRQVHSRLAWVPISGADRANVTGKGTATATFFGDEARYHARSRAGGSRHGGAPARGIAKAARGPAIGT